MCLTVPSQPYWFSLKYLVWGFLLWTQHLTEMFCHCIIGCDDCGVGLHVMIFEVRSYLLSNKLCWINRDGNWIEIQTYSVSEKLYSYCSYQVRLVISAPGMLKPLGTNWIFPWPFYYPHMTCGVDIHTCQELKQWAEACSQCVSGWWPRSFFNMMIPSFHHRKFPYVNKIATR